MATLGENLRKIRKAKKMTQAVLAQKIRRKAVCNFRP